MYSCSDFIHIMRKVECSSKKRRKCFRSCEVEFSVGFQFGNRFDNVLFCDLCLHLDAVLGPITEEFGTFGAKKIGSNGSSVFNVIVVISSALIGQSNCK